MMLGCLCSEHRSCATRQIRAYLMQRHRKQTDVCARWNQTAHRSGQFSSALCRRENGNHRALSLGGALFGGGPRRRSGALRWAVKSRTSLGSPRDLEYHVSAVRLSKSARRSRRRLDLGSNTTPIPITSHWDILFRTLLSRSRSRLVFQRARDSVWTGSPQRR
jgi:hypothetical protein